MHQKQEKTNYKKHLKKWGGNTNEPLKRFICIYFFIESSYFLFNNYSLLFLIDNH